MAMHDPPLRTVSPDRPPTHRKTSILDLPTDVLSNVFDYFRDGSIMSEGSVEWSYIDHRADANEIACRQTVRNSRLVCHLFHDLASPLLCPVLRVQLDEASLDRVNKISHSPRLAASVYGIQVVLHYRPRELAADLSRFKACRLEELKEVNGDCEYHAETWHLAGRNLNDDTLCPLPYWQYDWGMSNYRDIRSAWSRVGGRRQKQDEDEQSDEDEYEEGVENEASLEYQQILLQGHEAYKKKHEEQFRLIADGSFVSSLAASMSRMIHADSLGFIDKIENGPDPYFDYQTLLLTNMEELRKLMTQPHDWATIEELEGASELLPPKLLSELPIAIHKAGVKLRDVNISCFPVNKNQSMVCPDRQDPSNPAWSDLRAACQSISKFNFGSGSLSCRPIRHDYLPADQQSAMDQYLGAMLSGPSLETVRLSFHAFSLHDGRGGKEGPIRIGKMLEAAVWPRISRLTISQGAISQSELEQFCTGLGYCLTLIHSYRMELTGGSWAGALDILRDRVGARGLEGRCKVYVSSLTGGEFGEPELEERVDPWDQAVWVMKPDSSLLVKKSNDYISGANGTENPLRKNRS